MEIVLFDKRRVHSKKVKASDEWLNHEPARDNSAHTDVSLCGLVINRRLVHVVSVHRKLYRPKLRETVDFSSNSGLNLLFIVKINIKII